MSNAKLWCFRCCWLELPIGQTVKLPVVWDTITLMWRPCDIIQLMSLYDVEWENTCTGHLFKRHMMECRQPQYAPITINSLCLTWSKVVSFFFLNSDAVRGWQQNYSQAWNHCGSSHRNADILVVNVLVWTVLTWIRIHPRNTRRHQCVVASTGRLTTGRSLSLTRPYDNSPSLVTELLISQDFPQRHFCTYFTVS